MAHVNITKDLTEVKSKVVFGLTRRQLIFFALAALVAVPTYFRVRFLTQQARPYRTQNRFAALERQAYFDEEVKQLVSNTEKTGAAQGRGLERRAGNTARHKADRRTKKATGKSH